jgi:hypothetical protein
MCSLYTNVVSGPHSTLSSVAGLSQHWAQLCVLVLPSLHAQRALTNPIWSFSDAHVYLLTPILSNVCFCCFLRLQTQVAKFIPRGVIMQYLGAQRELYIESPAAAALSQHMPAKSSGSSHRVVRSPMTGTLVEVRGERMRWIANLMLPCVSLTVCYMLHILC